MPDVASFSAVERLRNRRQIEIRALRPSDRSALLAAAERTSDQALYRRFFGVRRDFSHEEVESFVNVDFVGEVALVAVAHASGQEVSNCSGGTRVESCTSLCSSSDVPQV